jgi:hypothetical protein
MVLAVITSTWQHMQVYKKWEINTDTLRSLFIGGEKFQICPSYTWGDCKVTQPVFKYLLMVAVQYNLIGLLNTQYHCDCTGAHTGHIML